MTVSAEKTFTQPGHGLAPGEAAYYNGSWEPAQADAAPTLAEALVTAAAGDDLTVCLIGGVFVTITGHGLGADGAALYLSAAAAGGVTTTEPSGSGQFSQVIGQVIDVDTLAVQALEAEGPL